MTKIKKFKELSDDIVVMKNDIGDYEKITEPVELVQITGILTDQDEIDKIEESFIPVTMNDNIKRGEIIWLTAIIKPKNSSVTSYQNVAVIKARIVEIYHGMGAMKNIKPGL